MLAKGKECIVCGNEWAERPIPTRASICEYYHFSEYMGLLHLNVNSKRVSGVDVDPIFVWYATSSNRNQVGDREFHLSPQTTIHTNLGGTHMLRHTGMCRPMG